MVIKQQFDDATREAGEAGTKWGTAFVEKMIRTIEMGMEAEVTSLGSALSTGSMLTRASEAGGIIGAAYVAAIGAGVVAGLADVLVKVGDVFEDINRQIALNTSASGEAFNNLKEQAKEVAGTLDTPLKKLGGDIALLNQRLGLTGEPLKELTSHVELLRDRMGDFNLSALAGQFQLFDVSGKDADEVLASLTQSAISGNMSIGQLVATLQQGGATLKEAGFNLESAGHFIGDLEKQGVPAAKAVAGMEAAAKAFDTAVKNGKGNWASFGSFLQDVNASIAKLEKTDPGAAQRLAAEVYGPRRWAEAKQMINEVNAAMADPHGFEAQKGFFDELKEKTETLKTHWQELKNQMITTLEPIAAPFIDDLVNKLKDFGQWAEQHKDDLKNLFEGVSEIAGEVLTVLKNIATILGEHPGLIQAIFDAFMLWKGLAGITWVYETLGLIIERLGLMPAAAATAEAGIETAAGGMLAALNPVAAVVAAITAGLLLFGSDSPKAAPYQGPVDQLKAKSDAFEAYAKDWKAKHGPDVPVGGGGEFGDRYNKWMMGQGPMPPELAPYYHDPSGSGGPIPFYAIDPNTGKSIPLNAQGQPLAPNPPGLGTPPPPEAPKAPEAPGGNLLPGFEDKDKKEPKGKKGPRLPAEPELPMPPGYGAPPEIGETEQHYKARMDLLKKQHELETDRARLQQLEHDNNATQDDIQKVKNKILTDQTDINEAQARLNETANAHLKKQREDTEQIGAKIDNDFGISKGLAGIAENLTKFLANLAAAPAYGQLMGQVAAGGGGTGGGLIGNAIARALGLPVGGAATTGRAGGVGGMVWSGSQWVSGGGGGVGGGTGGGSGAGLPNPASLAGEAKAYALSAAHTPYVPGSSDCSGYVSQVYSAMVGSYHHFTTESFDGAALGFRPVPPGGPPPGSLVVGISHGGPGGGHMAATLPNGVPIESGGGTGGGPHYGGSAHGGMDTQFTEHWYYRPGFRSGGAVFSFDFGGEVPIMAHSGEHVFTADDVTAMGGQDAVYAFRSGLHMQEGGGIDIHKYGGTAGVSGYGSGSPGMSPELMSGAMAAAGALDVMAPGASVAAQIGIKELNRVIEQMGKYVGIGVSGLMETFLPTGASQLAQSSWLTRIAGGLMGASPAMPNTAGQLGGPGEGSGPGREAVQPAGLLSPERAAAGLGDAQPGKSAGPTVNHNTGVHIENYHVDASEDRAGHDLASHVMAANAAPGMRAV